MGGVAVVFGVPFHWLAPPLYPARIRKYGTQKYGTQKLGVSEIVEANSVTNRFEVVNCQACGRRVARKSRQQRFCSDRCRDYEKGQRRIRKSFLSTDTRASPNPHFL